MGKKEYTLTSQKVNLIYQENIHKSPLAKQPNKLLIKDILRGNP